jgi:RNA polymerase sigma-70 factor (ECF subfamily)
VKESRSIPFAPHAALDEEAAVESSRFRRFALRGRGQWKVPPQSWTDPEQHALDAETLSVVSRAVDHLPPAQREVLTMRDLVGWSAPEVCDALEISEANQRVLLHRARSRIRTALERHFDESRQL